MSRLTDIVDNFPLPDDEEFNGKISALKEFKSLSLSAEGKQQENSQYFNTQLLIRRLLAPVSTIREMYVNHEIGSGKTGVAIAVAELYKNNIIGIGRKRALIVVKGDVLEESFKQQLNKITSLYLPNKEHTNEAARKGAITKKINEFYEIIHYSELANKIKKEFPTEAAMREEYDDRVIIFDEAHNFRMGYFKNTKDGAKTKEDEKKAFAEVYGTIKKMLHALQRRIILLFSATPIVDKPEEFGLQMNLILPEDKQIPADFDWDNVTIEKLEPYLRGRYSYVRGSSNVPKANPIGEKITIPVSVNGETKEIELLRKLNRMSTRQYFHYQKHANIKTEEDSDLNDNLLISELNNEQKVQGSSAFHREDRYASLFIFPTTVEEDAKIANAVDAKLKSRFPDADEKDPDYLFYKDYLSLKEESNRSDVIGMAGFNKWFDLESKTNSISIKQSMSRDSREKMENVLLSYNNLRDYSATFYSIIESSLANRDKSGFIYTEFVKGPGALLLGKILDTNYISRFDDNSFSMREADERFEKCLQTRQEYFDLIETKQEEKIDDYIANNGGENSYAYFLDKESLTDGELQQKERRRNRYLQEYQNANDERRLALDEKILALEDDLQVLTANLLYYRCNLAYLEGRRYAVVTGETTDKYRSAAFNVFNHPKNIDGRYIQLIVGTNVTKEGISFVQSQCVHIVHPYWNSVPIMQAMGRVFREDSLKDLPILDRIIDVYMHAAIGPDSYPFLRRGDTFDEQLYIDNRLQVNTIDMLLYAISEVKQRKIAKVLAVAKKCAVDGLINKERNQSLDPSYDYTEKCDYEPCRYACVGSEVDVKGNPLPPRPEDDTNYFLHYSSEQIERIKEDIKEIFKYAEYQQLDSIIENVRAIDPDNDFTPKYVVKALQEMVTNQETFLTSFGIVCTLKQEGPIYYIQNSFGSNKPDSSYYTQTIIANERLSLAEIIDPINNYELNKECEIIENTELKDDSRDESGYTNEEKIMNILVEDNGLKKLKCLLAERAYALSVTNPQAMKPVHELVLDTYSYRFFDYVDPKTGSTYKLHNIMVFTEGNSYNADVVSTRTMDQLRIFRDGRWRRVTRAEQISCGSQVIQQDKERKAALESHPMYGSISTSDGKFRIHLNPRTKRDPIYIFFDKIKQVKALVNADDRRTLFRGCNCTSASKKQIIIYLLILGYLVKDSESDLKKATNSAQRQKIMQTYRASLKDVYNPDEERKKIHDEWMADRARAVRKYTDSEFQARLDEVKDIQVSDEIIETYCKLFSSTKTNVILCEMIKDILRKQRLLILY